MSEASPIVVPSPTGPGWLKQRRTEAAARFAKAGLPTRKREDWRYTNLRGLSGHRFAPASKAGSLSESMIADWRLPEATCRLVFVDGVWSEPLSQVGSLPSGLTVGRIGEHGERLLNNVVSLEEAAVVDLSTASFGDGAWISTARGALLEAPIEILHVTTERAEAHAVYPRVLVSAGAGSALTIIERHVGLGSQPYLSVPVTEVSAEADANVKHVRVQEEGAGAYHLATTTAAPGHGAQVESHVVSLGALISRSAVHVRLGAERSGCRLTGAFAASDEQSQDHYTVIDHAVPHCDSHEVYKGLVGSDKAVGSFLGRVLIREGAAGSATDQLCRALLLTDAAKANVKPSLEIDNDDVRASHGAAIGQLDADHLFFLRTRGLTAAQARALLIGGFVREVLTGLPSDGLGDALTDRVLSRLLPGEVAP